MHLKFNGAFAGLAIILTFTALASSRPAIAATPEQAMALPLIVPEPVFASLGRVTSNLNHQRIMDRGSIIRIRFPDDQQTLPADTAVVFFKQGLRLSDGERNLGILAIPVGYGHSLTRVSEAQDVADPVTPGIAWVRLERLRQEVARGDSIMTRTQNDAWAESACPKNQQNGAAKYDKSGAATPSFRVIALADSKASAGILSTTQDLVVVSGGCKAGLENGQPISLWRPSGSTFGRKLDQPVEARDNDSTSVLDDNPGITRTLAPGLRIGHGIVAAAYTDAAIVRIRVATQPVQVGDEARPTQVRKQP